MPVAKADSEEPEHIVAAKRVFDVAKPGESKPSDTSRPVIVGHKTLAKDPMVSGADTTDDSAQKNAEAPSRTAKKIEPLTPVAAPAEPVSIPVTKQSEAPTPEAKASVTDDSDAAVVDAVLEQTGKKKKESEVDSAKEAEIQKLIDSKKYYVPIGAPARKRNAGIGAVLVLLVLVGGAVAAIDAGLLLPGTSLPFDFIK